jgi:hypothetical protein
MTPHTSMDSNLRDTHVPPLSLCKNTVGTIEIIRIAFNNTVITICKTAKQMIVNEPISSLFSCFVILYNTPKPSTLAIKRHRLPLDANDNLLSYRT